MIYLPKLRIFKRDAISSSRKLLLLSRQILLPEVSPDNTKFTIGPLLQQWIAVKIQSLRGVRNATHIGMLTSNLKSIHRSKIPQDVVFKTITKLRLMLTRMLLTISLLIYNKFHTCKHLKMVLHKIYHKIRNLSTWI